MANTMAANHRACLERSLAPVGSGRWCGVAVDKALRLPLVDRRGCL